jgi:tetrahydromethanopterin S-methyltransferase subunit B
MRVDNYHHIVMDPTTKARVDAVLEKAYLLLDQLTRDEEVDRLEAIALKGQVEDLTQKLKDATPQKT